MFLSEQQSFLVDLIYLYICLLKHYYFFYINNGHLEVRLNGGGGAETFFQVEEVNVADGAYHTVTCIKDARRFTIYMDDEHESPVLKLVKSRVIEAPVSGGFFIGGTRELLT